MADETYLFKDPTGEHIEVKKTGRTALDVVPAIGTAQELKIKLVQITPVEIEEGRWKKFVSETKLITIDD